MHIINTHTLSSLDDGIGKDRSKDNSITCVGCKYTYAYVANQIGITV